MPVGRKICRVCGNEYEVCRTKHPVDNTFRWQDVACSPECGAEYLRRIKASRSGDGEVATASVAAEAPVKAEGVKRSRKRRTANAGAKAD